MSSLQFLLFKEEMGQLGEFVALLDWVEVFHCSVVPNCKVMFSHFVTG
jgi:hypothetical protein